MDYDSNREEPQPDCRVETASLGGRRWRWITAVMVLYATSFLLPVYSVNGQSMMPNSQGFRIFIDCAVTLPTWWANPILWLGLMVFARGYIWGSRVLAAAAVLVASTGVLAGTNVICGKSAEMSIGYHFWWGSMAVFLAGTIMLRPAGESAGEH
jgi:hypothetical protein